MNGRLRRWLLAATAALAVAGCLLVATQSRGARESSDFTFYYSAALLVAEGRPGDVYRQPALDAVIRRVAPESAVDRRLPFNLPLAATLPLLPLTLLPLDLAFRVWQVVSLLTLLFTVLLLNRAYPLGRAGRVFGLLGLAAAVPAWAVMTEGQVTPLLVLGAALVLATQRKDLPWLALPGGALLAVKPHFLPVYLLILIAACNWRAAAAALAGASLVLLSPLVAGGPAGMRAMVGNAIGTNQLVPVRLTEAWSGVLAIVVPSNLLTLVSLALYAGTLALLAVLAARRVRAPIAFAAVAAWVSMLASPHVLPHDLLLLIAPTWLVFYLHRQGLMASPVVALLLTELALLIDLRGIGLVVAPLAMTAVTAWGVWEFRRRAERHQPQPAAAAA